MRSVGKDYLQWRHLHVALYLNFRFVDPAPHHLSSAGAPCLPEPHSVAQQLVVLGPRIILTALLLLRQQLL